MMKRLSSTSNASRLIKSIRASLHSSGRRPKQEMKGRMIKCAKRWMPSERSLLRKEMKGSRERRNRGIEKLKFSEKRGNELMMLSRNN
jgi:hypothetical protein